MALKFASGLPPHPPSQENSSFVKKVRRLDSYVFVVCENTFHCRVFDHLSIQLFQFIGVLSKICFVFTEMANKLFAPSFFSGSKFEKHQTPGGLKNVSLRFHLPVVTKFAHTSFEKKRVHLPWKQALSRVIELSDRLRVSFSVGAAAASDEHDARRQTGSVFSRGTVARFVLDS